MVNIFSPKSLQPLKGPDVLPPMDGPQYDASAERDQIMRKPDTDLRYRPIPIPNGGVGVLNCSTWKVMAVCADDRDADRICVALDDYDKNHPRPF